MPRINRHRRRRRWPGEAIRKTAGELHIGVHRPGQLDEPLNRQHGIFRVERLFESGTGVGSHAHSGGRSPDGRRLEIRRFEQQRPRAFMNFGVAASHDARDRDRSTMTLDHQLLGGKLALYVIQRAEGLTLFRPVDFDSIDVARVEGMHRLTEVGHNVVGQIDQPRNGPKTDVPQAELHPERCRLRGNARQQQAGISSAGLGIRDADRNLRRFSRRQLLERHDGVGLERKAEDRRDLPRHAVNSPKVGPVSDRFIIDLDRPVFEQIRGKRLAGLEFRIQKDRVARGQANAHRTARQNHAGTTMAGHLGRFDRPISGNR